DGFGSDVRAPVAAVGAKVIEQRLGQLAGAAADVEHAGGWRQAQVDEDLSLAPTEGLEFVATGRPDDAPVIAVEVGTPIGGAIVKVTTQPSAQRCCNPCEPPALHVCLLAAFGPVWQGV